VEGKGEPVVLIHGFAVNIASQWVLPGVVKALAKDYQVIALDLRGHGRSDKPHAMKQYGQELVEDVVRLLDHLKIKRAHVVGYSMGGLIALKMVTEHPDRVLTATLGGMGLIQPGTEPMFAELAEALENGRGLTPLLVWLTPVGQPKVSNEQVQITNKFLLATNDVKALAAVVRSSNDKALTMPEDKLRAIRVPMLALIGDVDPLQKRVVELKQFVPKLEVVWIKGGDHMSAVFDPVFINKLREFLGKHSEGAK
jgi:pimeloyl-ACP methyl ester carboxylesterase